jgi:hypothetical protein
MKNKNSPLGSLLESKVVGEGEYLDPEEELVLRCCPAIART